MKPEHPIAAVLGGMLVVVGVVVLAVSQHFAGLIPLTIGLSLAYLGYRPGRASLILFGHACVVTGCLLVTWGVYLLPHSEPTLSHILGRPFFWGLFSIFGGICAIQHGFCRCISVSHRSQEADAQGCTEGHPRCSQQPVGQVPRG
jgi:hypothetical protein